MTDASDDLLTTERAGQLLAVDAQTIQAWQGRGRLTRVDKHGQPHVPAVEVTRLLQSPVRTALLTAATLAPVAPEDEGVLEAFLDQYNALTDAERAHLVERSVTAAGRGEAGPDPAAMTAAHDPGPQGNTRAR